MKKKILVSTIMTLGLIFGLVGNAFGLAPYPNYGTGIVVDGDPSDWDLTNDFFSKLLVMTGIIGKDEHAAVGVEGGEDPIYEFPDEKVYLEDYGSKYFDYYTKRMGGIPEQPNAKICVIGHTHHAYLDPEFGDGKYIFIDAGAWTGPRSDFAVITNEETAVCCYKR